MEYVTVPTGQGNILRETEKAILWYTGFSEVWLPKSQITVNIPVVYEMGNIEMPLWLWRKISRNAA